MDGQLGWSFKEFLAGTQPLWKSFWLFYLPCMALGVGTTALVLAFWGATEQGIQALVWLFTMPVSIGPPVVAISSLLPLTLALAAGSIGVWRCAPNASAKTTSTIARYVIVLIATWTLLKITRAAYGLMHIW